MQASKAVRMDGTLAPNWKPLEIFVGVKACPEWMWMQCKDGHEYYKHIETRAYLILNQAGQL